jgi:hypothetical protein
MATLIETVLNLKKQEVMMRVKILVQGNEHIISCVTAESALAALASQDSRPDWNSTDCAQVASTLIGQDVVLPAT